MRRIVDIIFITIFLIHFTTNTLINIIGVPLAAYHSYQTWKEVEITTDSLQKHKEKTKRKVEHNNSDTTKSIEVIP